MTLIEFLDTAEHSSDRDTGISDDLAAHYFPLLTRNQNATVGVHERKGTAMLRCITAMPGGPSEDIWNRTVSTDRLIADANSGALTGPVLLIDDLLRTGRTVIGVVQ